jgi:hypothetical protein
MPIIENNISGKVVVILKSYILVYRACLSKKDNIFVKIYQARFYKLSFTYIFYFYIELLVINRPWKHLSNTIIPSHTQYCACDNINILRKLKEIFSVHYRDRQYFCCKQTHKINRIILDNEEITFNRYKHLRNRCRYS